MIAQASPSVRFLSALLVSFGLTSIELKTHAQIIEHSFQQTQTCTFDALEFDLIFFELNPTNYSTKCQIIKEIRQSYADDYIPIAGVIPNNLNEETLGQIKHTAFMSGITDLILTSEVSSDVVNPANTVNSVSTTDGAIDTALRLATMLDAKALHKNAKQQYKYLEDLVGNRTNALIEANADLANVNEQLDKSTDEIFERLARAAEFRDDTTGKHTERVGNLAAKIAVRLSMPESYVSLISKAARLHDLGKIGIPDSILLKPSRFTEDERELMMRHCEIGAELLSGSDSPLLNMAQRIALSHHEKLNGEGYPNNLVADEIPLEGRIVAVADVYDALSHNRPYKHAWPKEDILTLLNGKRGVHFDADVIDALVDIVNTDSGEASVSRAA